VLACIALVAKSADAQANRDEQPSRYETKVYNIADLLDAPMMLEDDGQEFGKTPKPSSGGFGGGGTGGGGMGGGGMFRIPDNILPQMAGMGGGGGGFGGGGMGGGGLVYQSDHMTRETLEQIVLDHVSDDDTKWLQIDGDGGKLSVVGSMMIVTQTAAAHAKVVQLLELLRMGNNTSPTVQVDVRIVEVTSDQPVSDLTSDIKSIEKLANDTSAARMSLRCDNHRIAKVSSGLRRSYIVSLTPVVGSNGTLESQPNREIAYQPVTYSPLLGLFGKIKPEINADGKQGRIHLGIQLASGPEEVISATFGTGQSIDRVELETAQLSTSIATDANTWTLAGSVAVTNPTSSITSGEALSHLAVLVRWTVVE